MKRRLLFTGCGLALLTLISGSCVVNTNPVGPGIDKFHEARVGYYVGKQYKIEDFEPGSNPDPAVWFLKLNIPSESYPSDGCISRLYPNYPEVDESGVTNNRALGIWYKIDGWADQYYWWAMGIGFVTGNHDLNRMGNAIRFRIKAVKYPGALAGSIKFLLSSPNAASVADITQSEDGSNPLDEATESETESLKGGLIPLSWEWQTIVVPFSPADIRGQSCSGFEFSLNLDTKGQGGFILIDDIELIEYYEKN